VVDERISLLVEARDPVSEAGIKAVLRTRPEVRLVESPENSDADVALVVADEVDEETLRVIRAARRNGTARVLLIVTQIDDAGLLAAVEAGVSGLVRRADATAAALAQALRVAAAGDGTVPPDLLGRLLSQIGRLQRQLLAPRGLTLSGLNQREIEVLRLVAEGLDTGEIAKQLSYSERTIKNVIYGITTRLQLKNRSQAVAYAVREGLI
jgi:DNA-binding NarL/FixJ family response regulator